MNLYPDNHQAQKNRYAVRRSGLGGLLLIAVTFNPQGTTGDSLQFIGSANRHLLAPLGDSRTLNLERIRYSANATEVRNDVFLLHITTLGSEPNPNSKNT